MGELLQRIQGELSSNQIIYLPNNINRNLI